MQREQMSEVLVEFDTILTADDGTRWVPRACGGLAEDGLWEGWIEFLNASDEADTVRTARETEQPNRDDLMYWSQGLTHVYLEGALVRARDEPDREGDAAHTQSTSPATARGRPLARRMGGSGETHPPG